MISEPPPQPSVYYVPPEYVQVNQLGLELDLIRLGACRRCKQIDTGPIRSYQIDYPGGWSKFACCPACKDAISIAIAKLLEELGI